MFSSQENNFKQLIMNFTSHLNFFYTKKGGKLTTEVSSLQHACKWALKFSLKGEKTKMTREEKLISYFKATKVKKNVALPGRLFASKGTREFGFFSMSLKVSKRVAPTVTPINTFSTLK